MIFKALREYNAIDHVQAYAMKSAFRSVFAELCSIFEIKINPYVLIITKLAAIAVLPR